MYNLKIKNVKLKSLSYNLSYNTFTYITRKTIFRRVFKRYRNTFKKSEYTQRNMQHTRSNRL